MYQGDNFNDNFDEHEEEIDYLDFSEVLTDEDIIELEQMRYSIWEQYD